MARSKAVMDDGWNDEIRRAVAKATKEANKTKAGPKVTDKKKKKAAVEAAIKKAGENFKNKK